MKPHRPVDLDAFDRDFFSPEEPADNKGQNDNTVSVNVENGAPDVSHQIRRVLHPSLTADVIEGLMKIKLSVENPVFHDLPEEKEETDVQEEKSNVLSSSGQDTKEAQAPEKAPAEADEGVESEVSEEDALKSFPDFDFDPTIFNPEDEDETGDEVMLNDGDDLKAHRERAKQELKDEKKRLKAQKKLEKKVQRPFKSRRKLVFLLVLALLIGIIASGLSFIVYKTGSSPKNMYQIGDYYLCYIDGTGIQSSKYTGSIIVLEKRSVTSNKAILFDSESGPMLEDVIAIGDGVCAVTLSQKVCTVKNENIVGVVYFYIGNMKLIYNVVHFQTTTALVVLGAYFGAVIIIFSLLIALKNKKIKKYRENYQIVS